MLEDLNYDSLFTVITVIPEVAQGTQRNVRKINKEIIRKQKAAKKFSNQ